MASYSVERIAYRFSFESPTVLDRGSKSTVIQAVAGVVKRPSLGRGQHPLTVVWTGGTVFSPARTVAEPR